jgi:hypothetical protein
VYITVLYVLNAECIREKNYNVEDLSAYIADKKPLLNQDQKRAYQFIMGCGIETTMWYSFLETSGAQGKHF